MLSRIATTTVVWVVILTSLYFFGDHAAVVLLTALGVLTLHELYGLTLTMGARPFRWMGLGFSALMIAGPFYAGRFIAEPDLTDNLASSLLIVALLVSCVRVLGERDPTNRVETIAATVLGLLFVPFLLQFLVRILMLDADNHDNLALCLWVVTVSKFCDVGALLSGLAFGRHKMAPLISPKKTWEGAVGGVLFSAGTGAAFAYFASEYLPGALTPAVAAVIGVPLALTTILSDLIESAIKRRAGTKDTGQLFPGIGGAFDLTDSLLLTAPVAYYIFSFL